MADGWGAAPHSSGVKPFSLKQISDQRALWREHAETYLRRAFPEASCADGLSEGQLKWLGRTGAMSGLAALFAPGLTLGTVQWLAFVAFALIILYRLLLVLVGAAGRGRPARPDLQGRGTSDGLWPKYTLLVPVFREPAAVSNLITALEGIDYPASQLEVFILLEACDDETLEALNVCALKPHFQILQVPEGDLRTKPRALNYGLQQASGQYVAVYDAEDAMHASQLKDAVRAFQASEELNRQPPLACIQAPLIPHNGRESWISGQFEVEYLVQFGLVVPALCQLKLPVLLGGTSNHFRKSVLEEIGGWDPHNVTEDADLGLRLARCGYRVGSIAPPTYEEAPIGVMPWVRQRSRWIKGFLQTACVFFRVSPLRAAQEMGALNYVSASLLLLSGIVSALVHGPLCLWLLAQIIVPGWHAPESAVALCVSGLSMHLLAGALISSGGGVRRWLSILTAPAYWPLQTIAAAKAIWELKSAPYFWDKTDHGVTRAYLDPDMLVKSV